MRTLFPPGGTKVTDWIGLTVRTRVDMRNGNIHIPAGTLARVTHARSGLTLRTEPCPHCGVRVYITRVATHDVSVEQTTEPRNG